MSPAGGGAHLGLSTSNFYSRLCFVCACLVFYSRRLCLTRFRVIELLRWRGGLWTCSVPTTSDFRIQIFTVVCVCFCFYSHCLCLTHFRDVKHWRREGPKDIAFPLTNFLFLIDLFVYSTFVHIYDQTSAENSDLLGIFFIMTHFFFFFKLICVQNF
jgi:hypothetical protein